MFGKNERKKIPILIKYIGVILTNQLLLQTLTSANKEETRYSTKKLLKKRNEEFKRRNKIPLLACSTLNLRPSNSIPLNSLIASSVSSSVSK
jgi:hypothetical protein